jgi:hypothetical protein
MVARVTLAEVDVVRTSLGELVEFYEQSVPPAQHAEEGYEGGSSRRRDPSSSWASRSRSCSTRALVRARRPSRAFAGPLCTGLTRDSRLSAVTPRPHPRPLKCRLRTRAARIHAARKPRCEIRAPHRCGSKPRVGRL